MNKTEIIKAIAEHDDHTIQRGIFGDAIVENCIKIIKQPLDIERIKPLIDSISFLIAQITECEHRAAVCQSLGHSPFEMDEADYTRQANKYRESLIKTLEQL